MDDALLEKLRKILNLAGKAGTQGEAEAALARAQEIAIRYNIELADIELGEDDSKKGIKVERDQELGTGSKFKQPYHDHIANVLMNCFDVRVLWHISREVNGTRVSSISIFGEKTDIAICKQIFPWLEKVFPAILRKGIRTGILRENMACINGCYSGISKGLQETNQHMKDKLAGDNAGKYAMVVRSKADKIDELFNELYPDLKDRRSSRVKFSEAAFNHGKAEGSKINLNQMNSGTRPNQLR